MCYIHVYVYIELEVNACKIRREHDSNTLNYDRVESLELKRLWPWLAWINVRT